VGVRCLPPAGAAVGEYRARRDHPHAARVGSGIWFGPMAGLPARLVPACAVTGIFIVVLPQ